MGTDGTTLNGLILQSGESTACLMDKLGEGMQAET
jgi:hypothetical protein